jgi:hypothetical protein
MRTALSTPTISSEAPQAEGLRQGSHTPAHWSHPGVWTQTHWSKKDGTGHAWTGSQNNQYVAGLGHKSPPRTAVQQSL